MNRIEYLDASSAAHVANTADREAQRAATFAVHREYYAQFVTAETTNRLRMHFTAEELLASTDPHFNDINIRRWDAAADHLPCDGARLRDGSDYVTQAGLVCIIKEAARQYIEAHPSRRTS